MSHPDRAKINRKLAQRAIALVVILAVVFSGVYWIITNMGGMDFGTYNSVGQIAAIETVGDGSQAVIIKPDGTIVPSPDYKPGNVDHDIVWKPDGNRVFFDSDRYNEEPHVFRWNPGKDSVDRRTLDRREKGQISFVVPGAVSPSRTGLLISGGMALELDPNTGNTKQVLPPSLKDAAGATAAKDEGGGGRSQIEALYGAYGDSFVKALWTTSKRGVLASLSRDNGQAAIYQDLSHPNGRVIPLVQGDHVDFDVNPKTGGYVLCVTGFQVPDWDEKMKAALTKNGRIVPPFKHLVALFDPASPQTSAPLVDSNTDQNAFAQPRFSPDGQNLLILVGTYAKGQFEPNGIVVSPVAAGLKGGGLLAKGDFQQASWEPNGSKILAVELTPDGKHSVVEIDVATHVTQNLTGGKGDFTEAVYSPQVVAP